MSALLSGPTENKHRACKTMHLQCSCPERVRVSIIINCTFVSMQIRTGRPKGRDTAPVTPCVPIKGA